MSNRTLTERTLGTMPREKKGPVAPPPALDGALAVVTDAVRSWPGVVATVHWDLYKPTQVDGVDFYIDRRELGHLHLDGSLHLATSPALGRELVNEGVAHAFPYQRGWVDEDVDRIGSAAAIALFRRNYDRLVRPRV